MEVLSKLWSGTHMLLFPLEMSEATGRHWCHLQVRGLRILMMSIEGSRIEEDMALWWPGKTGFSCNQVHKLWHHLDLGDIWRTGEKSIFRRRIWRKDSVKRSLHPGSLIGIESGDKDFHRRSGEVVEAWSLANTVPLARTRASCYCCVCTYDTHSCSYCRPNMDQRAFQRWSPVILTADPSEKYYHYSHFADEG